MPLASITPSHMLYGVFMYGWPIISLLKYFIGEGPTIEMVATYSFMDLPQDVIRLGGGQTFQKGECDRSFVKLLII